MKIIEVRDGFVKFETDNNVKTSEFFRIKGMSKDYIAQAIRIKDNGISKTVYAKFLFIYDGIFRKYDKTLPDSTSEIFEFPYELIQESIESSSAIVAGKFISDGSDIKIDETFLDKKTMMSVDSPEMRNTLTMNFARQLARKNKVVIIDMAGVIQGEKYTAGVDFKLPLNKESLKFIYEDCLSDATSDSKNLIKDIFADLSAYSETVDFLPFKTLKNIIDEMVTKDHIFKLLVLKNKLAKFEQSGYFASSICDAENLSNILKTELPVIDLSKLDAGFQNRYLSVITSEVQKFNNTPYVIIQASNAINKANLKNIVTNQYIKFILGVHSRFKYLCEMKEFFKSFFVEPTYNNKEAFKLYSMFLNEMTSNSYLIVGECTNFIPIVSKLEKIVVKEPVEKSIEELINVEQDSTETEEAVAAEDLNENSQELSEVSEEEAENQPETETEVAQEENLPLTSDCEETIENEFVENNEETKFQIFSESDEVIGLEEDCQSNSQEAISEQPIETESFEEITAEDTEENIESQPSAEESEIESLKLTNNEEKISFKETFEEKNIDFHTNVDTVKLEEIDNEIKQDEEISNEIQESAENEVVVPEIISENDDEEDFNEILISDDDSDNNIEPENAEEDNIARFEEEQQEQIPVELNEIDENTITPSFEEEFEPQTLEEITEEKNSEAIKISEPEETESEEIENIDIEEESIELPSELEEEYEAVNLELDEPEIKIAPIDDFVTEEVSEESHQTPLKAEPLTEESDNIGEITELDPSEADDNDILVELDNTESDGLLSNTNDELEQEIVEDVDKVFTTIKDDVITDNDLDFIDELSDFDSEENTDELVSESDFEELENFDSDNSDDVTEAPIVELSDSNEDKEILEEKSSSTPIVPVYDAQIPDEDKVVSDKIEQGDTVTHAKYGTGIVEKMIKYGNKNLYSINFDNVGRRLLDPTLTEIKKA